MDHGEIKGKIVYSLTNKPMREYRIAQTDLGRNIYKRIKNENWTMHMWFLDWQGKWTLRKDFARIFYRREDAADVLWLVKIKDGKKSD